MTTRSRQHHSPRGKRRWSQHVMETSDALDLKSGTFAKRDPAEIARSLKASAEHSKRRKSSPFPSAMSMLNFYINRGGRQLPREQRQHLEAAKDELRVLFGRPRQRASRHRRKPA
ncbi:MAG TPA: DUF3175 domain-containing protein [Dyella sp.]|uniref:DUF3175 domain-containing protein n=1 Tax=Dyella sp. TaxID=1869338 RepID=UPI002D78CD38|nr:DUF3175 domain-containing protein [Dyella sp.]HET6552971.1 DUF3175 domain-containing protein [Dyella sp.]